MGFTERASCRPYKNCYTHKVKGGSKRAATKRRSSRTKRSASNRSTSKPQASKQETGNITPSKKHTNVGTFVYHSEHTSYTSHPNKNTPFGKRTIVNITNGVGKKQLAILDKSGKTLKVNNKKLNAHEISELKQGNYIPGLWISV